MFGSAVFESEVEHRNLEAVIGKPNKAGKRRCQTELVKPEQVLAPDSLERIQ